jgi:hypothetical protein
MAAVTLAKIAGDARRRPLREGAARDGFPIPPARYRPFRLARERQGAIIGLDRFGAVFASQAADSSR